MRTAKIGPDLRLESDEWPVLACQRQLEGINSLCHLSSTLICEVE